MTYPEPLQQDARELAEKYRWSGMNINALPALCEALLTEPRDEWRDAMDDDGPCTDCDDTGVTFQTERNCTCGAATPTEQPEPSEDYLRRACEEYGIDYGGFAKGWYSMPIEKAVHTVASLLQQIDEAQARVEGREPEDPYEVLAQTEGVLNDVFDAGWDAYHDRVKAHGTAQYEAVQSALRALKLKEQSK